MYSKMGNMAISMGQEQSKNPMQNELCYFDKMHRTYDGWKTLNIMGFHPFILLVGSC